MANIRIKNLPAGGATAGTDMFGVDRVNGDDTVKITAESIGEYVIDNLPDPLNANISGNAATATTANGAIANQGFELATGIDHGSFPLGSIWNEADGRFYGTADYSSTDRYQFLMSADLGLSVQPYSAATAYTDQVQNYTAQQYSNPVTLTGVSNVFSWNVNNAQVAVATISANSTINNPTNVQDGAIYYLAINNTGSFTMTWDSNYIWTTASGGSPSLNSFGYNYFQFIGDASGKLNGGPFGQFGAAPSNAAFILKQPNGVLPNAQALSSLATGYVKVTTGTGVLTSDNTVLTSSSSAGSFPTLNQNTSGNAATVTTNANLTGDVTSSGNATTYNNSVPIAKGGTGQTGYALGDTLYSSATNTLSKLAGNTTTTPKFLMQTGTGSVSAAPSWSALIAANMPAGMTLQTLGVSQSSSFSLSGVGAVDWTGMAISITSNASRANPSKFVISLTSEVSAAVSNSFQYVTLWVRRNGGSYTQIAVGNAAGSATPCWIDAAFGTTPIMDVIPRSLSGIFYYDPGLQGTFDFKCQILSTFYTGTVYFGRTNSTTDANRSTIPSTLTVQEIAA